MSDIFAPAGEPPTLLGRLRVLSPHASVRVSPLCLGAMNLGESWSSFMGDMNKKTAFEILDAFYTAGGNFIDTANNYQNEESELWIGEWMQERQNRDQMVIATKFSSPYKSYNKSIKIGHNYTGNSTKSLHISVRDSLKKLKTDYIDILYIHFWDFTTSIEELMTSLNVLINQGKVLYLGASDVPAWVVVKANEWAKHHGMRGFCVYQGKWNAAFRDLEREILPMCKIEGLAVCPWSAVGGGKFKSEAELKAYEERGEKGRQHDGPSENDKKVTKILERLSKTYNSSITAIALAYVMQKQPYVFPIVGGRKVSHLMDNIKALSIKLSTQDIMDIENAIPFDLGFPISFSGPSPTNWLLKVAGQYDWVEEPKAIGHV